MLNPVLWIAIMGSAIKLRLMDIVVAIAVNSIATTVGHIKISFIKLECLFLFAVAFVLVIILIHFFCHIKPKISCIELYLLFYFF